MFFLPSRTGKQLNLRYFYEYTSKASAFSQNGRVVENQLPSKRIRPIESHPTMLLVAI